MHVLMKCFSSVKQVFKKHKLDGLIAPVQSMPNVPHTLTKYLNMIAAETITYNVTDSSELLMIYKNNFR